MRLVTQRRSSAFLSAQKNSNVWGARMKKKYNYGQMCVAFTLGVFLGEVLATLIYAISL